MGVTQVTNINEVVKSHWKINYSTLIVLNFFQKFQAIFGTTIVSGFQIVLKNIRIGSRDFLHVFSAIFD